MAPHRHEMGYALVTAVVAMAVLALASLAILQSARGVLTGAAAANDRARMVAAADAGTVLAIHALADDDRAKRWSIDGRTRETTFDHIALTIRVEDERGKIPINLINDEQVRAMFEALGAQGARLDALTDAFLDWRDDDDDVRPAGAERDYYARFGRTPRNGELHSVDELADIKGMTPDLAARLRRNITLVTASGQGFDDRYATPLALAVMSGGGTDTPAVIQRQRELDGQRPAIDLADNETLAGRMLMIRVNARGANGAAYERRTIIELTGSPARPLLVRGLG
jgi:general secretion pathway protein K